MDYHFAAEGNRPAVDLTWYHGPTRPAIFSESGATKGGNGTLFVGERGMMFADYGKYVLLPQEQFKDFVPPKASIPPSIGHHQEWIKACKEGTPTTCNFDYSGALAETVLLGNVAYRSGKKISWNPETGTTGDAEADRYLKRDYRKGWEL